jgi:hypothetical protein
MSRDADDIAPNSQNEVLGYPLTTNHYIIEAVKSQKQIGLIAGVVLFIVYLLGAARPIPLETVLVPRWLNSLEFGNPMVLGGGIASANTNSGVATSQQIIPFSLGDRFGYISRDGHLSVNQTKKANLSLSPDYWAEYEAEPSQIMINGNNGETVTVIEDPRGYPFFLDGKIFLINSVQTAISAIDVSGETAWTYEFAAPLTCADSAAGLVLIGSLDGMVGLLDSRGRQIFSFDPGGSRYSVILGCAISRDGSRLALICGIDEQRFLILEHFGSSAGDYKVVYHEFLGHGFRRPVYITFAENDRWVVFERGGGLGFYEISSRKSEQVKLDGEICAIDHSGGKGMVFTVVSYSETQKKLIGIRLPNKVIIESPFISKEVFLGRMDSRVIAGGGQTLASFDLEKR